MFQSSRVARPQDASEALYLGSLLGSSGSSALSCSDAYEQRVLRPVPEIADNPPASQCGFGLRSGQSWLVEFVEEAVEHVGFFLVVKKAGAQRFILDARSTKGDFQLDRCLHARDLVMQNFMEHLRTLRTGLSAVNGNRRFLHCPVFSHLKLAT